MFGMRITERPDISANGIISSPKIKKVQFDTKKEVNQLYSTDWINYIHCQHNHNPVMKYEK